MTRAPAPRSDHTPHSDPQLEHGKPWTYKQGCRCDPCTAANTAKVAAERARRYARTQRNGLPPDVDHGPTAYLNHGCRCTLCTQAHTTAQAAIRSRVSSSDPIL